MRKGGYFSVAPLPVIMFAGMEMPAPVLPSFPGKFGFDYNECELCLKF